MVGNHMDLMIVIHCPAIGAGMVLDEPLFYSARMDPLVLPENVLNPPNQAPVLFFSAGNCTVQRGIVPLFFRFRLKLLVKYGEPSLLRLALMILTLLRIAPSSSIG